MMPKLPNYIGMQYTMDGEVIWETNKYLAAIIIIGIMITIYILAIIKPLIDPEIVDNIVSVFRNNSYDYITNFLSNPTFPSGTEVEVFSINALKKAWEKAKLPSEKEHVTPYFVNHEDEFKITHIENSEDLSDLRWAVDRIEDLKLVRKIVSKIKKRPIIMMY